MSHIVPQSVFWLISNTSKFSFCGEEKQFCSGTWHSQLWDMWHAQLWHSYQERDIPNGLLAARKGCCGSQVNIFTRPLPLYFHSANWPVFSLGHVFSNKLASLALQVGRCNSYLRYLKVWITHHSTSIKICKLLPHTFEAHKQILHLSLGQYNCKVSLFREAYMPTYMMHSNMLHILLIMLLTL